MKGLTGPSYDFKYHILHPWEPFSLAPPGGTRLPLLPPSLVTGWILGPAGSGSTAGDQVVRATGVWMCLKPSI